VDIVNTASLATASDLSALFIAFEMRLQQQFDEYDTQWEKFASVIPTSTEVAKLPFLSLFPQFREWDPGTNRHKNNYVLNDIQVTNLNWELSAEISRPRLMDDQFGAFLNMAPAHMARQAMTLPDREIVKYIENTALTLNDWDTVPYFDGYHPIDPTGLTTANTQSNLFTSLTTSGDVSEYGGLNPTNFQKLRARHLGRRAMDNSPMGLRTTGLKLMVHPDGEYSARIATSAAIYPQGLGTAAASVSNVWASLPEAERIEVIVNSWLDTTKNAWYLLSSGEVSKPFYWSQRMPLELTTIVDPQNPIVYERNVYSIGAYMRGAAFQGLYYLASKATSNADANGNNG
jgi:phage major head subunit gpT-like protein